MTFHPPCKHPSVTDGLCDECGCRAAALPRGLGESRVAQIACLEELVRLDMLTVQDARDLLDPPDDAERAKRFGSAGYEAMAQDVDQVKTLARAAWVRSLPLHVEGETISDYAARAGILPPKPGKREQWADAVLEAACERLALEHP